MNIVIAESGATTTLCFNNTFLSGIKNINEFISDYGGRYHAVQNVFDSDFIEPTVFIMYRNEFLYWKNIRNILDDIFNYIGNREITNTVSFFIRYIFHSTSLEDKTGNYNNTCTRDVLLFMVETLKGVVNVSYRPHAKIRFNGELEGNLLLPNSIRAIEEGRALTDCKLIYTLPNFLKWLDVEQDSISEYVIIPSILYNEILTSFELNKIEYENYDDSIGFE